MLSFFPTPYPDELWYSVIARYHTHSGALSWQATMAALFGDARDTDVGSFFPNNSIHSCNSLVRTRRTLELVRYFSNFFCCNSLVHTERTLGFLCISPGRAVVIRLCARSAPTLFLCRMARMVL